MSKLNRDSVGLFDNLLTVQFSTERPQKMSHSDPCATELFCLLVKLTTLGAILADFGYNFAVPDKKKMTLWASCRSE